MTPEGLVVLASSHGPRDTIEQLKAAVTARGMAIFAQIDHAGAAKDVGMTLAPTELLIFGSPKAGTPLMQASQTLGIDLPLKALVWQDSMGKTWLGYNDPQWLARRHGVIGYDYMLDAIATVLAAVAKDAC
jgi:uncharacterized protein (DUF302 family)